MKPVDQTILDFDIGNCLQACVASILELPLERVPNFMVFRDDTWWPAFQWFLYGLGYQVYYKPHTEGFEPPKDTHIIAGIVSPRNSDVTHAVVYYNGKIIHDPHPDKNAWVNPQYVNWKWWSPKD